MRLTKHGTKIMTLESEDDLEKLKACGRAVRETIAAMGVALEPGMTTAELDDLGRKHLESFGARSAPELSYDFPGATCISLNNIVAHGIPGDTLIEPGDMVNIDVSAELDGYFTDSGASFIVPPEKPEQRKVCDATKLALTKAIRTVKAGARLNVIGRAIEEVARKRGLSIIENLASHGVGRSLHEDPGSIPSYYDRTDPRRLTEGLVITIEPFLSTGAREAEEGDDGWSLMTPPEFVTAQYEHTMVVTRRGAMIIT